MRSDRHLRRLALFAWLAWMGWLALLFGMLRARVRAPHFAPITALSAILIAAAACLLATGVKRLIRGPRRREVLAWLLIGLAPSAFVAAHALYGWQAAESGTVPLNLPMKLLVPLGESMLDLYARFVYPQRTVGERVVMISAKIPEATARAQVDAMDRHVRALESRLGRAGKGRVHWVRGPLLGMQGKALFGVCLGSTPGEPPTTPDRLTILDRHEVAHCVLAGLTPADAEPPAVLVEGWAEGVSGLEPTSMAVRAYSQREVLQTRPLRELVGPDWYARHERPVYTVGGPFVQFLLDEYGPGRFLELYSTCRPDTFDADCRRILGVSVNDLDRSLWAAMDARTGGGTYAERWLNALKLGPGVSPEAWHSFVQAYVDRVGGAFPLAGDGSIRFERTFGQPNAAGTASEFRQLYEIRRSGPNVSYREMDRNIEEVMLARAGHAFRATRRGETDAWEVHEYSHLGPEVGRRLAVLAIETENPLIYAAAPLLGLAVSSTNLVDPLCAEVRRLEHGREDGREVIRVDLVAEANDVLGFREVRLVLSADDLAPIRSDVIGIRGIKSASTNTYEAVEGCRRFRSMRSESEQDDGTRSVYNLVVLETEPAPPPDSVFTREHLLGNAPRRVVERDNDEKARRDAFAWYQLPLGLGLLAPIAGASLLLSRRRPVERRAELVG